MTALRRRTETAGGRLDLNLAPFSRDGFGGVDEQVHDDLLNLARIGAKGRRV